MKLCNMHDSEAQRGGPSLIPGPASIADTSEVELMDVSARKLSSLYHRIRRSELNTAKDGTPYVLGIRIE